MAARRIVPIAKPLRKRLEAEWTRQGRPAEGRVCPPRRESRSGMVSLEQLQKRVIPLWEDSGLTPIGLQDSRHTAATWFDHAGISPKVASVFMGHKAPGRHLHLTPLRSPCAATPTFSLASWSAHATSLMTSSQSANGRKERFSGDLLESRPNLGPLDGPFTVFGGELGLLERLQSKPCRSFKPKVAGSTPVGPILLEVVARPAPRRGSSGAIRRPALRTSRGRW